MGWYPVSHADHNSRVLKHGVLILLEIFIQQLLVEVAEAFISLICSLWERHLVRLAFVIDGHGRDAVLLLQKVDKLVFISSQFDRQIKEGVFWKPRFHQHV